MFERFGFPESGRGVIKICENAVLPLEDIIIFSYRFQEIWVLVYSSYSNQITVFTHSFLHVCTILIEESNDHCRCELIWLIRTDNVVGDTATVVHGLRLRSAVERNPMVVWLIDRHVILPLCNHLIENALERSVRSRGNRGDVVSRVPPCVLWKPLYICSIKISTTLSDLACCVNKVSGADSPFVFLLTDIRWCGPRVSGDIYIFIWVLFDELGESTKWVDTSVCHLSCLESAIRSTFILD